MIHATQRYFKIRLKMRLPLKMQVLPTMLMPLSPLYLWCLVQGTSSALESLSHRRACWRMPGPWASLLLYGSWRVSSQLWEPCAMLSSGSPSPNLEVTTPTSRTYLEDWQGKRLCEGLSGLGSQGQVISNIPRRAREWDAPFASLSWLLV